MKVTAGRKIGHQSKHVHKQINELITNTAQRSEKLMTSLNATENLFHHPVCVG